MFHIILNFYSLVLGFVFGEDNSHSDSTLFDKNSIFSSVCDHAPSGNLRGNFWMSADNNDPLGFFIISLNLYGNRYGTITKITVRNTIVTDSATKDFEIAISKCQTDWKVVIQDTFPDPSGLNCESVSDSAYPMTEEGKFIRFVALSHYGNRAALSFIDVDWSGNYQYQCPSK